MKKLKLWIQEIHLLMLDVDVYTKRCMIAEIMVAIILLLLGAYWGGRWLLMAVVVFFYVCFDMHQIYRNGIVESALIDGVVITSKWNVYARLIKIHTKEGRDLQLFLPHHVTGSRIRRGDHLSCRISLKKEPGNDSRLRILTYKVTGDEKKEG